MTAAWPMRIGTTGFGVTSSERMAQRLCELGLLKPYVHGGHEITEAGRGALAALGVAT